MVAESTAPAARIVAASTAPAATWWRRRWRRGGLSHPRRPRMSEGLGDEGRFSAATTALFRQRSYTHDPDSEALVGGRVGSAAEVLVQHLLEQRLVGSGAQEQRHG